MDRRESIKSLLVGSIASGAVVTGCAPGETPIEKTELLPNPGKYGRTPKEASRDLKLNESQFFTESEIDTIAILCDLILPPEDGFKSATDAEVPAFIEFIVKDLPYNQTPIRGGIMWLDNFANETFGKTFKTCSDSEQKNLLDQIAYPNDVKPHLSQGAKFFSTLRNLTLTGFYTSQLGVEEIGYKGNAPNVWDGVPDHVLQKHGMSYEDDMLPKYVDQSKRMDLAAWDDEGNLIS